MLFFHLNDIDLSEGHSGLQRHDVIKGLRNQDLLVVVFTKVLNFVTGLKIWTHVAGIDLALGTDCSFDRPTCV